MKLLSFSGTCAAVTLLIFSVTAPAFAQTRIAGGYQFQHDTTSFGGHDYPMGFGVEAEQVLARSAWSLVADVATSSKSSETTFQSTLGSLPSSGTFETSERRVSVSGGLRWTPGAIGALHPHVQALGGVVHGNTSVSGLPTALVASAGENEPLLQIGGGVTQPIAGRLSVIGQVDYRHVFGGNESVLTTPPSLTPNVVRAADEVRILIGAQIAVLR